MYFKEVMEVPFQARMLMIEMIIQFFLISSIQIHHLLRIEARRPIPASAIERDRIKLNTKIEIELNIILFYTLPI